MAKPKPQTDEPDFFLIDENELDREWIEQPKMYYRYAVRLADARRTHDQRKTEVDIAYAEAALRIRNNPGKYDLEKITDASVKEAIIRDDEYQSALEALNNARHEMDVLDAAVKALDHRKRALENLVELHGQNYFSTPRAPSKEASESLDKKASRRARRSIRDDDD